jgi:hypothetical protein
MPHTRVPTSFVNSFSTFYLLIAAGTFVYLWIETPVLSEVSTDILRFTINLLYVICGALVWPGTLLAIFA